MNLEELAIKRRAAAKEADEVILKSKIHSANLVFRRLRKRDNSSVMVIDVEVTYSEKRMPVMRTLPLPVKINEGDSFFWKSSERNKITAERIGPYEYISEGETLPFEVGYELDRIVDRVYHQALAQEFINSLSQK